jgi:hypothetical protein
MGSTYSRFKLLVFFMFFPAFVNYSLNEPLNVDSALRANFKFRSKRLIEKDTLTFLTCIIKMLHL